MTLPHNPRAWHPRHWPTAAGLGVLWLVAKVPQRHWLRSAELLAKVLQGVAPARRGIVLRNLQLAFPDQEQHWRERICSLCYQSLALSVLETAKLWFADPRWLRDYVQIEGLEQLQRCQAQQQPVVLVSCHYCSIEVAGAALCQALPFYPVYAAAKNAYFDAWQRAKRLRFAPDVVLRSDMRKAMRVLRSGGVLWMLPDQAVASSHGSVPSTFFGQPVMSTTGPSRLQKSTAAQLIVFALERRDDGGLLLRLRPPESVDLDADPQQRAQQLNDVFERMVRSAPEAYFWHHKRFKSGVVGVNPYR